MNWSQFLTITHVIGTILGVGGSTFAELIYRQANADRVIDPTESSYLRLSYRVLRVGLVLLVLSGFGLLVYARLHGRESALYSPKLWIKLGLTVVILVNALLLEVRKTPVWLGAAVSVTSWYTAAILGAWRGIRSRFLTQLVIYLLVLAAVAIWFKLTDRRRPNAVTVAKGAAP